MNRKEPTGWITPDVYVLHVPFIDVYTTVCVIRTCEGIVLFDAATTDADIEDVVLPALHELGIAAEEIRYLFLSHPHRDHAGGASRILREFPHVTVVSREEGADARFPGYAVESPADGALLCSCLRVVAIPGHTADSTALLDTRSGLLIAGDCLQLYGLYGSGIWGANVRHPVKYEEAIARLRADLPARVLVAHCYEPYGALYEGAEEVGAALDACLQPLADLRALIERYPEENDEALALRYNAMQGRPPLTSYVVAASRAALLSSRSE